MLAEYAFIRYKYELRKCIIIISIHLLNIAVHFRQIKQLSLQSRETCCEHCPGDTPMYNSAAAIDSIDYTIYGNR